MIDYFPRDGKYYFEVDSKEMFSFFRIIDHLTTDGAEITDELKDEAQKLMQK